MKKKGQKTDWLLAFLIGTTLLSAVAAGRLSERPYHELIKPYGLTTMLLFVFLTGLGLSRWKWLVSGRDRFWVGAGYLASILLLVASMKYPVHNLWFVGSAFLSIWINSYIGAVFHFILSYLYCGLHGKSMEWLLFYAILGTVICLLAKYFRKCSMAFYGGIVVLCCNTILLFVMNNFVLQESINRDNLHSIGSTAVVLLAAHCLAAARKKRKAEEPPIVLEPSAPKSEPWKKNLSTKEIRQMEIEMVEPKETIYDSILEEDYVLLQRLREKSPGLYAHSQKVGDLAANGAVILGCSEKIAKAGGLYHEIGRLAGKNYIEEGASLLAEYGFPKEVIDVVRQQNSKLEKPRSKEAAIVMLTESVVSTVAYFEKEKKKAEEAGAPYKEQPIQKIIENIFDIRLGKGSLDESGVTVLEYKKLKNYYIGLYS